MCPIDAIEEPTYMPAMRIITAITQAEEAVITTSFAHGYVNGTIVRLYIPDGFGMWNINGLVFTILIVDNTSFRISIDTRYFDPFIVPVGTQQRAQVIPIGSEGQNYSPAVQNVLPY